MKTKKRRRGRPPGTGKGRTVKTVGVALAPAVRDAVDVAARRAHMSRSKFISALLVRGLKDGLKQWRRMTEGADDA